MTSGPTSSVVVCTVARRQFLCSRVRGQQQCEQEQQQWLGLHGGSVRSLCGNLDTVHATGGQMRRMQWFAAIVVVCGLTVRTLAQAPGGVTVFEGARVIVGDGRPPIENASFVVDGARIVQVGASANVRVPAGAARVDLAGKTVMPAIIDTHTHLSQTREALLTDLKRRAYFGVGAALSLGQDTADAAYEVRSQTMPGMARFFTAGRGITGPEPGRTTAPYWVTTTAEARKAVEENAARKVDIIKIWVDDRWGR
jgi:hypothetical protein